MTVTIRAILDFPAGSSIGIRAYKDSAPDTQSGSDIILAEDGTRDNLYEASGVSLDASTQYTVDIYTASDDANIDASGYFAASPLYVGVDGGTYFVGGDKSLTNQTSILSSLSSGGGTVIANVLTGGVISLKENDDHTIAAGNEIPLEQPDAGGALYALFTAAETTMTAGFRRTGGSVSEIVGTIDTDNITYADDVTTIPIEVAASATTGKTGTDWFYDIQRTLTGGEIVTDITGTAQVLPDNAT